MKLNTLYSATAREAVAHLLAVAICTGVLLLFVALTYSQITLPRYTTKYTEKDVQQVVNLVITVLATVIGILFSHCCRLTNEAETRSELRNEELTIPRLHVHFEAASGSKVAMGIPVARNKEVRRLVAFYFLAMLIFAFVHSVLSVIFVVDAIISDTGELVPLAIPLSIDIPEVHNGTIIDPCYYNINSPDCTYDLALHSLSSQLVTYQEYTIAGVTFQPPNGTMGLPYHAMKHFREEVANIPFEDARRRYCLPVLDPQVIKCEEVLINGTTCASEDNFVKFKSLNVSDTNAKTGKPQDLKTGLYKITSPYPNNLSAWGEFGLRIDSQGKGVMIINQFLPEPFTTLVGAANAWGEIGYASMLHRLMFDGVNPDYSGVPPGGTYDFAARCKLTSIRDHDAIASSWRQVDFTLSRGVLHANVTEERCPNARSPNGEGISGFSDLPYALQGAGDIVSSTDGYSKFFNEHPPSGQGSEIFATMSRFETVVNQIYHIIQTHWTESSYDYAMQVPRVHEQPVMMTSYPHLFVIRISWTPTTYIGLVLSLLIALNAIALAWRWARATYCFGFGDETWNLLRPVDLMAYSLAATHDLIDSLNTRDHRRMEMRGTSKTVLREHLDDLKNPIAGAGAEIPGSESTSGSPLREYYREKIQTETTAPEISVQERQPGLEQGQRRT